MRDLQSMSMNWEPGFVRHPPRGSKGAIFYDGEKFYHQGIKKWMQWIPWAQEIALLQDF